MKALEHFEHRPVEEGTVGLQRQVHLRRYPGTECLSQVCQPRCSGEKRLAAVEDDVEADETVVLCVLSDALGGFLSYSPAHAFRHVPPGLIRHFVDIAVRTRQITTTVYFQDKLPEGCRPVSCRAYRCHVEVEQRPGSGMSRYPDRCHLNQAAGPPGPFPGWLNLDVRVEST
jgi:hypothetical protein